MAASCPTLRDALCGILQDLSKSGFKVFKWKLSDTPTGKRRKNIPKGELEGADVYDTIDCLISYYAEEVKNVVIEVLKSINENQLAKKLENLGISDFCSDQVDSRDPAYHQKCLQRYFEEIERDLGRIKPYNADPGEWIYLDTTNIAPLITENYPQKEDKEREVSYKGMEHQELYQETSSVITIEDLYKPGPNKLVPKTVVLHGAPGMGKTFTAHKMMLSWKPDEPYQGLFQYLFLIKCREVSQLTGDLSLDDVIFGHAESLKPIRRKITQCSEKTLLILDGFDELKLPPTGSSHNNMIGNRVFALLKKELPGASVFITTRPEALDKVERVKNIDLCAELRGFSEEEKKKYFLCFFKDPQETLEAFNHVKSNGTVFTMCYIPLVCWIVCTVLKDKGQSSFPQVCTMTQVFLHYTSIIQRHHSSSCPSLNEDVCQKLNTLAFQGVKDHNTLFSKEDLEKLSLDDSKVPSSLLSKMTFKKGLLRETVYSFVHLTFQEFFAALHCMRTDKLEEAKCLLQESLNWGKSHQIPTVQYLFGLVNSTSTEILPQYKLSKSLKQEMLNWIRNALKHEKDSTYLKLLYYLYEVNEDDFVKCALEGQETLDIKNQKLNREDCLVIGYCLRHFADAKSLYLKDCRLGEKEIEAFLQTKRTYQM
nr:PREDICTED: NACHT, LRR and PYD domains-containing protein 3-like [Latimeria chalumnae]|eukprot:XP_006012933.1 PREDICTED: NACHT, LRR and PYD domains-containing protein 3-like [Latimeria chalumnae]